MAEKARAAADIALIQAPPWGPEGPPLGLAQLSSFIRSKGFATQVIDLNIRCYRAVGRPELWTPEHKDEWVYDSRLDRTWDLMLPTVETAIEELEQSGTSLVGLSVSSDSLAFSDRLLAELRLRLPGARLLVGGTATATQSQRGRFNPKNLDLMVVGDGELTTVDLMAALRSGGGLGQIRGLIVFRDGEEGPLEHRPFEQDLDSLGGPTFEEFDLGMYSTPNLPLLSSRGCPRHCALCNDRVLMGPLRRRTGRSLFDEVMRHVERHGCRDYMLNDLAINANLAEILEFCRLVVDSGETIRFNGNAWVSEQLDAKALRLLKAAGCHTLSLGIESGSDRVLGMMNKGFTAARARAQMERVKAAGITLWINLVIGFPGETEADLDATLELLRRDKELIDAVSVLNTCNILPGSILAERPEEYGIVPSSDARWHEVDWIGRDGSTPVVRRQRQVKALKLARELGIEVRQSNVSFEDEASYIAREGLDLAIVLPPPLQTDMPSWDIAALIQFLRGRGRTVRLIDWNIEAFSRFNSTDAQGWPVEVWRDMGKPECVDDVSSRIKADLAGVLARLQGLSPGAIYIHATQPNRLLAARLAKSIGAGDKRPTVLVGGPSALSEAERFSFDSSADFFVLGDPEQTVLELLGRPEGETEERGARGALPARAAEGKQFRPREPLKPMDVLPAPSFDDFSLNLYTAPALPIRLGRGCPFRCAFCGEQPVEGPFRQRSAQAVISEMLGHVRRLRRSEFVFSDLIADADPSLLREVARLISESGERIRWRGQMAPRPDLDAAYFKALADGGCISLHFGVETFSNDLLKLMNKEYDAESAIGNLRSAHDAGIRTHVNLIVGFPGETDATFMETARLLRENAGYIDAVDRLGPCHVPPESLLERFPADFEIKLFEQDRFRSWSHKGFNNPSWRDKKAAELAFFIEGLAVEFNAENAIGPRHVLRPLAPEIRRRMRRSTNPRPDVILATAPPWGFENPPVGLAYLSHYVRSSGSWADVLDFNIEMYRAAPQEARLLWHVENKNFWSNEHTFKVLVHLFNGLIDGCVERLLLADPKLVGFSVVDPKERVTLEFIRRFRRMNKSARIILGGPATFTPEYRGIFLDQGAGLIDAMVIGEGEAALMDVIEAADRKENFRGLPGVLTWDQAGRISYAPRQPIEPLDRIPWPRYEEFDLEDYPGDSLIVEWSRGCIGTCTYCKGKDIAGRYRPRSAGHIFEEMKHHVEALGLRDFTVCDPLINGDPGNLERLCDMIIDSGLRFTWRGEGIPLRTMRRRLLDKMARAGCVELQLGIECASDLVLRRMNKIRFFNAGDAARVIRDTHEAGIKTCLFIIVGFPGETEREFERTLNFVRENAAWIDQIKSINSLHIITGTPLHLHAGKFGLRLPDLDYHYLWEGPDNNTIEARNDRIRRLLKLCRELGIEVRETNLAEGKQYDLADRIAAGRITIEQAMAEMLTQINALRSFDEESGEAASPVSARRIEEKPAVVGPEASIRPRAQSPDSGTSSRIEIKPAPEKGEPPASGGIDVTDPAARRGLIQANRDMAGVLAGDGRIFIGPDILEIDLTCNCNSNCVGCWVHSDLLGEDRMPASRKKQNLPYEVVDRLLMEAATMGTRMVQLTGAGEPFMHPRIMDIIGRAKDLGLAVTLITNFTLVDKRRAKRLVELGVDNITASVWAGSPDIYKAAHPKLPGNTLDKIKSVLIHLHEQKRRLGRTRPHVKVYNVISKVNRDDIDNMISFAVDSLAEFIEFTPIDIVEGRTESLALSDEDRRAVAAQLAALPSRADYLELDPSKGSRARGGDPEGIEFARFVKRDALAKDFKYELDDISRFDALCRRKEWQLQVEEDNKERNALLFFYPEEQCRSCELLQGCSIDKERFLVAAEFLSFKGFGSFYRRITSPGMSSGLYDAEIIDKLPCTVGWTYSRVLTNGDVIPCCKADDMPMGNLFESSFREIWGGERYREFRVKARDSSKRDSFFDPIQCLKACDNLGTNRATKDRLDKLTRHERDALEDHGRNETGL